MAFASLPASFRSILGAGLAVTLPVLLTGCGETSGGQSLGAGPALFSMPSSPPLVSSPDIPFSRGGFLGGGASGGSPLGGSSPQSFSGQRTGRLTILPSDPEPAAPQPRPTDSVPGPVPVLGAAAAFGCSRRLRRRIKHGS